jgi:hypothetical protein
LFGLLSLTSSGALNAAIKFFVLHSSSSYSAVWTVSNVNRYNFVNRLQNLPYPTQEISEPLGNSFVAVSFHDVELSISVGDFVAVVFAVNESPYIVAFC